MSVPVLILPIFWQLLLTNGKISSRFVCRLIILNKNPGKRPIGAGKVLRRVAGKVAMNIF